VPSEPLAPVIWLEGNSLSAAVPYHGKVVTDLMQDDATDMADDIRGLFAELDKGLPDAGRLRGECRPALDVVETAASVEVIVDIPGVSAQSVRLLMRRNLLVIAGAKPPSGERPTRFHLAERNYGRFARTVRVDAAVDATRARATLRAGQLRIVLPRVTDRRGQPIPIAIESAR
jgi:HSP20 family protein